MTEAPAAAEAGASLTAQTIELVEVDLRLTAGIVAPYLCLG